VKIEGDIQKREEELKGYRVMTVSNNREGEDGKVAKWFS